MIVVIDYNVGNVKSVCNTFGYIGCDVKLSCQPETIGSGAGTLEHLYDATVDGGADAVLMASITHFGNYTIRQMKEYLANRGIAVNL